MAHPLILASASKIRLQLLENAGVKVASHPARIDEAAVKEALIAEGAPARDIADTLAELKAQKISSRHPGALVIGCDQVATFEGRLLTKPQSKETLLDDFQELRGKTHKLLSAAVIYSAGEPQWRYVGEVRLAMRTASDGYLSDYIDRNWDEIQHCVGGYMLEGEGVRLFERVTGDYFHVLGIPLIELLSYLAGRGEIDA